MRESRATSDLFPQVAIPPPRDAALRRLRSAGPGGSYTSSLKRAVDIGLASTLLLLCIPIFLVVALLIKIDTPGPVFFTQRRAGRHGRPFAIVKFRSMHQDAERRVPDLLTLNEADGPLFKIRSDPRATRVGRVLRRFSIDELPQLVNVLAGDMSLVGPRPPLLEEVERYEEWQHRRLDVLPGITGLWQVSGRSDLPFDVGIRLDLEYVDRCSLLVDLQIIVRTVNAVLFSRGAY